MPEQYAYFSVTGYGSHQPVTELLEISPSIAWSEGDVAGNGKVCQFMHWRLDSGISKTVAIEDHVEALLFRLKIRADRVRQLPPDFTPAIVCVGYFWESQHGFHLRKDQISTASHLGLEFDFDFYFLADDQQHEQS